MSDAKRPGGTRRTEVPDALFGELSVEANLDEGRITVRGESVPEVVVERDRDAPVVAWVPIGTRDPAALTLRVSGVEQELRPAKAGLTRKSYSVGARVGTTDLLLAPSSPTTARLVRGRSYRGDNELGTFERVDGEITPATWSADATLLGVTAKGLRPEPDEAAVGYALAAAFGTGAQFFIAALLDGAGRSMPV